jgi:hypothetical protein
MAISGNVRYSQIRTGDRSGNGVKVATVTGTQTAGKQLQFDASGNVIASGSDIGGGGGGGAYVIADLTPPINSQFTDLNSPTVTENSNNVYIATTSSGGSNVRGRIKAIPTAPFIITVGFVPQFALGAARFVGFGLYDGSKIRQMNFTASGSTPTLNMLNFSDPTTSVGGAEYHQPFNFSPMFFRLEDNNTNWIWSWSIGNGNWITMLTEARNTYLTPTHVGMMVNNTSTTPPIITSAYYIHWLEE